MTSEVPAWVPPASTCSCQNQREDSSPMRLNARIEHLSQSIEILNKRLETLEKRVLKLY